MLRRSVSSPSFQPSIVPEVISSSILQDSKDSDPVVAEIDNLLNNPPTAGTQTEDTTVYGPQTQQDAEIDRIIRGLTMDTDDETAPKSPSIPPSANDADIDVQEVSPSPPTVPTASPSQRKSKRIKHMASGTLKDKKKHSLSTSAAAQTSIAQPDFSTPPKRAKVTPRKNVGSFSPKANKKFKNSDAEVRYAKFVD